MSMSASTGGRPATPQHHGPNLVAHLVHRQSGENVGGFRRQLFRERMALARNLYKRDLVAHFGCVNAIEFSGDGELLVSGGDDRRVLLWRLDDVVSGGTDVPSRAMVKQHQSNIFCLGFNANKSKILSGGNDQVVLVHDVATGEPVDTYPHVKPVYGLSIDATADHMFATAGEDGRVLVFDMRAGGTERLALAKHRSPFHAIQFHPLDGNFVITANGKEGAAFWDLRQTKAPTVRYGGEDAAHSCMSICFNALGTQVLALRRRLPPILYNTCSAVPVAQFYHSDYYNSCTMKSCSFGGENDEYIMSGSDDFNLYVWRVTDADMNATNQWIDRHQMVLYGHRSIVNQVRYNGPRCCIASSGVEKVIKLWSPFAAPTWTGDLVEDTVSSVAGARDVFTHDEYVSIINSSGLNVTHDYSNQNTTEDPQMMAFFDSLVQREIEGWNSDDESDDDKSSAHSSDGSSRPTSTEEDSSDDSDDDDDSMTNYLAANAGLCRRTRYAAMKPRSIYANRIAYLIATKRNTLKRLALKGAAHTERRAAVRRTSSSARTLLGLRVSRKSGKRSKNRTKPNKRTAVSHEDHDDNQDSNAPKKFTKRRIQQHLNSSSYRLLRRKSKTVRSSKHIDLPDTSSDDNDTDADFQQTAPSGDAFVASHPPNASSSTSPIASTSTARNSHPRNASLPSSYTTSKTSKYDHPNYVRRTNKPHLARAAAILAKQTLVSTAPSHGDNANHPPALPTFPANAAVPSTSTGITIATGPIFRAQLRFDDSDEEEDEADAATLANRANSRAESMLNLVPVIPMPLNGTHKFDASGSSGAEDNAVSRLTTTAAEPRRSVASTTPDNTTSDGGIGAAATVAAAEAAADSTTQSSQPARRKRNSRLLNSNYANYSSHSNSRLSSSSTTDIDDYHQPMDTAAAAAANGAHKRARLTAAMVASPNAVHQVTTAAKTPTNRGATLSAHHDFTPDSGFLTNVTYTSSTSNSFQLHSAEDSCSSSSSGDPGGQLLSPTAPKDHHQPSTSAASDASMGAASTSASSSSYAHRLFQQKVARIRRNYRNNNFGDDSDSE